MLNNQTLEEITRIHAGRTKQGGEKRYRLYETKVFNTQIAGFPGAILDLDGKRCELLGDGRLAIFHGFIWDLASGAIDTPDMVVASLAHDALCYLTDENAIPWEAREKGDEYFRELLEFQETGFVRRWYCYRAVRAFSRKKGLLR